MTPLTLKDFFADGSSLPEDALPGLKDKLPGGAEGLAAALGEAMEEIFGAQIAEVLQASWGQVEGLGKALGDSRKDPNAVVVFPLVDHTVNSAHSPKIELFLGRKRLAELALEIELNLKLKGVALELRGGRIAGVRSGECAGEGVCLLGGQPLMKRDTPAIPLPGRLAFKGKS